MAIIMKKRKTSESKPSVSAKRPRNFSSAVNPEFLAQVHALEALLRTPIKFVPASDRTSPDAQDMTVSSPDRVLRWRIDKDERSKRRRLVLRHLSENWEPFLLSHNLPPCGLFNTGVICYRNSGLQVLMHLSIFMNWLEEYHHPDDCVIARDKCLACHLRRLKLAYWAVHASPQLRERAVRRVTDRMNNHINSMGWKEPEGMQHDAREFLMWMVLTVRNQVGREEREVFDATFCLVSDREIQCPKCKTKRFLQKENVATAPEFNLLTDLANAADGERLIDVLNENFHTQREARCENAACKDNGNKPMQQFITLAPEVFICTLKRFGTKGKNFNPKKIKTEINFPEDLDLSTHYGHPNTPRNIKLLYHLSSVLYHKGELSGGHYITMAKGPDNVWREMNDNRVIVSNVEKALHYGEGFTAFVLTYTKHHAQGYA